MMNKVQTTAVSLALAFCAAMILASFGEIPARNPWPKFPANLERRCPEAVHTYGHPASVIPGAETSQQ